jgi:myo-inositol-1(or 4)-monophosphatase
MTTPLDLALQTALQAGELLTRYFHQDGISTKLKADRTVVTEADLAADELIANAIHSQFPHDQILSEEGDYEGLNPSNPIWVVDPLDGTNNFSLGLPIWGISIARLVEGMPDTGVLHFPILQETYTTQKGCGAFLNGNPIHTKPKDPAKPMAFFTCCSRTHQNYKVTIPYKSRILGSAAYDICAVARGAALLGFQSKVKIWDFAAGWLLVEEAGGVVEVYQQSTPFPFNPSSGQIKKNYPVLMAATRELIDEGYRGIVPLNSY